jgi:Ca-activated chloride channel homolog
MFDEEKVLNDYGFSADIPLKNIYIKGRVAGQFAKLTFTQEYFNDSEKFIEGHYTFPLSDNGKVTGFTIQTNEKTIESSLETKKNAKKIYKKTIKKGDSAYRLTETRKNIFNLYCGNIPPESKCIITIEYMEKLSFTNESLRLMLPTVVGQRYVSTETIQETSFEEITQVVPPCIEGEVPYKFYLDLDFDTIKPYAKISSPSHKIKIKKKNDKMFNVTLLNKNSLPSRDFVLEYTWDDEIVTDYSVTKDSDGSRYLLINYLPNVEFKQTENPKEVIFLIDTSGSMDGSKFYQAQNMLKLGLRNLNIGDYFNIYEFNSFYKKCFKKSEIYNDENIEIADKCINNMEADGGTEIFEPIIDILKSEPLLNNRIILLLTDGEVYEDETIIKKILNIHNSTRIFCFGIDTAVNSAFLNQLAEVSKGIAEFILPNERIEEKVIKQFSRISSPVIEDINFEITGLENIETYPLKIKTLFNTEPITLISKFKGNINNAEFVVEYKNYEQLKKDKLIIKEDNYFEDSELLKKIWAINYIDELEKQINYNNIYKEEDRTKKLLIDASIKYNILTSATDFIGIEKLEVKNDEMPIKKRIPVMLPAEWEMNRHSHWHSPPAIMRRAASASPVCCMCMDYNDDDMSYNNISSASYEKDNEKESIYDLFIKLFLEQKADGLFKTETEIKQADIINSMLIYILSEYFIKESDKQTYKKQLSKLSTAITTNIDKIKLEKKNDLHNLFNNLIVYEYNLLNGNKTETYLKDIIETLQNDSKLFNQKELNSLIDTIITKNESLINNAFSLFKDIWKTYYNRKKMGTVPIKNTPLENAITPLIMRR